MTEQALTETPTALAGLDTGKPYTFQNKSQRSLWYFQGTEAPADADDTEGAFRIPAWRTGTLELDSGNTIWVWLDDDGVGLGSIVFEEEAS